MRKTKHPTITVVLITSAIAPRTAPTTMMTLSLMSGGSGSNLPGTAVTEETLM